MWETYGIQDMTEHPTLSVARLVFGLGRNSRLKMAMNDCTYTEEELMSALMIDRLSTVAWLLSDNSRKGSKKPRSLFKAMVDEKKQSENRNMTFDSLEEFEAMRQQIINSNKGEQNG